jgi:sensor histidine kinase YesM
MKMPSFILQPIVENSLLHGLKSLNYSGKIIVSLYRDKDDIITLSVSDNGIGFDLSSWERVKAMLESPDIDDGQGDHHIGIINVAQRLKMFYGDQGGLSYYENDDGGVTALIKMGEKCGQ